MRDDRTLRFFPADDDRVLCYGRFDDENRNFLLFHVLIDPRAGAQFGFELPLWQFGPPRRGLARGRGRDPRQPVHLARQTPPADPRPPEPALRDLEKLFPPGGAANGGIIDKGSAWPPTHGHPDRRLVQGRRLIYQIHVKAIPGFRRRRHRPDFAGHNNAAPRPLFRNLGATAVWLACRYLPLAPAAPTVITTIARLSTQGESTPIRRHGAKFSAKKGTISVEEAHRRRVSR